MILIGIMRLYKLGRTSLYTYKLVYFPVIMFMRYNDARCERESLDDFPLALTIQGLAFIG